MGTSRCHLSLRLEERRAAITVDSALADVYAGLLATNALVYSGEREGFQTRLYGIVDKMIPHLGAAALRKPRPAALEARATRFAELVAERWHSGYEDQLNAIRSLSAREREAVLLRDSHEWMMQEIAAKLRLPIEEARSFVREAQAHVRTWRAPELPLGN